MATTKHLQQTQTLTEKAHRIFTQAITAYNDGRKYDALSTARYALQVARKAAADSKSDICAFIAAIKLEFGQANLASYYCHQALVYLDKQSRSYGSDRHYLLALQTQIDRLN